MGPRLDYLAARTALSLNPNLICWYFVDNVRWWVRVWPKLVDIDSPFIRQHVFTISEERPTWSPNQTNT